ncbi:hypothetical protein HYV80_07190 [Candidatus Woesearchaeota archaeon]|nr:hypothetical protein [Candidatus Woesearchaeota archaeon]
MKKTKKNVTDNHILSLILFIRAIDLAKSHLIPHSTLKNPRFLMMLGNIDFRHGGTV